MKKQQKVNATIKLQNTELQKKELLHVLGGFSTLESIEGESLSHKCSEGCRKACITGCKSTGK